MQYLHLLAIAIVSVSAKTVECDKDRWWGTYQRPRKCRGLWVGGQHHSGSCDPAPYIPGGGEVIIEGFDAPQAEMQHNAISNMARNIGFKCDVTSDLADIAEAAGKAAENVKKLASHMGIWGSVFGFISGLSSPTADEILGAVNEALTELTDKINDQFTNMQGYVDQKVMNEAKDRWEDAYNAYYRRFTDCIKYDPKGWDDTIGCMEDVENDSGADFDTFMDFLDEKDIDGWKPSVDDIKRMELQFNVYNNYAHLRMMILLTLFGEYKEFDNGSYRAMAKTYLISLSKESLRFKEYTQFCYDKIVGKYKGFDHKKWVSTIDCYKVTNYCQPDPVVRQNTYAIIDCESRFDEVALLGSETCKYPVDVSCKGEDTGTVLCPDGIDPFSKENFGKYAYMDRTEDKWSAYHNDLCSQVINYWKPSVLKSQETFQQIHDAAEEKLKDYADVFAYREPGSRTHNAQMFSSKMKYLLRLYRHKIEL